MHVDESSLNSGSLLLEEVVAVAGVILVTWIFAKIDRQRVDAYGLPVRLAFRGRFWEGAALGVVTAGAVAAGMYALGGFVIHGFGLHGSEWIVQPLLWGTAMIFVGIEEEMWFRGYGLQALARGIGFWPAAAVTSLIFGGLHLTKPGENFIDIFNIIALGFLMAITVWRTGSLWLAVGFHFTFDLHAVLRDRHAQRRRDAGGHAPLVLVSRCGVGERGVAWYRSELFDAAGDRGALRIRDVALSKKMRRSRSPDAIF